MHYINPSHTNCTVSDLRSNYCTVFVVVDCNHCVFVSEYVSTLMIMYFVAVFICYVGESPPSQSGKPFWKQHRFGGREKSISECVFSFSLTDE